MLTGQPAGAALQMTAIDYFAGEHAKMWTAIVAYQLVAASAAFPNNAPAPITRRS